LVSFLVGGGLYEISCICGLVCMSMCGLYKEQFQSHPALMGQKLKSSEFS